MTGKHVERGIGMEIDWFEQDKAAQVAACNEADWHRANPALTEDQIRIHKAGFLRGWQEALKWVRDEKGAALVTRDAKG